MKIYKKQLFISIIISILIAGFYSYIYYSDVINDMNSNIDTAYLHTALNFVSCFLILILILYLFIGALTIKDYKEKGFWKSIRNFFYLRANTQLIVLETFCIILLSFVIITYFISFYPFHIAIIFAASTISCIFLPITCVLYIIFKRKKVIAKEIKEFFKKSSK